MSERCPACERHSVEARHGAASDVSPSFKTTAAIRGRRTRQEKAGASDVASLRRAARWKVLGPSFRGVIRFATASGISAHLGGVFWRRRAGSPATSQEVPA